MKALIVYWSGTGNTEKVAKAIKEGMEEKKFSVKYKTTSEAVDEDILSYDLICFGAPVHSWLPADPMFNYVKSKRQEARQKGLEKFNSPSIKGKGAIVFCTYAGPHTGHDEAIPSLKWFGQFFEHLGIKVISEIGVVGENHSNPESSIKGRLGDIRGRPNANDLQKVKKEVTKAIDENFF
jgi:flavorubredoxin